jgi:DNA-binding IclR family transcriptional regulator
MTKYSEYPISRSSIPPQSKAYLSRIASILMCLSEGINTLTEIAETCKLSKSTVHRLLQSLVDSQFSVFDPVYHRYYLGGFIHNLSMNPQTTHGYFISHAIEEMTRLWDLSEETVDLGILAGSLYSSLHEIPGKHALKITAEVMRPRAEFTGSRIKVLFSQLRDEDLETILKNISIEPVTKNTVTDKKQLLKQIKQIRQRGYSISYGERTVGAASFSAPIKNYSCPVVLSIMAFENSIKPRESQLLKELLISANRISQQLK